MAVQELSVFDKIRNADWLEITPPGFCLYGVFKVTHGTRVETRNFHYQLPHAHLWIAACRLKSQMTSEAATAARVAEALTLTP